MLLATAMSIFVAQSVAERVTIPHWYVAFSPTVLSDPDAQNREALFGAPIINHRASIGKPPVVVPHAGHQLYRAARVTEMCIGAAHDGPTPTTESLSAALRTTLTPEIRTRAAAVASTIRTDGATVAARLLVNDLSRVERT